MNPVTQPDVIGVPAKDLLKKYEKAFQRALRQFSSYTGKDMSAHWYIIDESKEKKTSVFPDAATAVNELGWLQITGHDCKLHGIIE
jgi:hypothetical protein